MKKIGVITIVNVNNYGAELQAYATQKKLALMGHDVELINYRYYKSWNFKDTKMSASLIPMGVKRKLTYWVKYRLINCIVENVLPAINGNVKRRLEHFASFHNKNSRFSRVYASMDELYCQTPKYDVYMTGSDQVWNPAADSSIEPYFLTFAPKGSKKVSYASSFGVSEIDNSLKEKYGQWLSEYDAIAVRESSGKELVKSLSDKDAEWVIDPTLILNKNEWMEVAVNYPDMPKNYVLIYQLAEFDAIDKLALRIGRERGIPVYRICKRAYGVKKTDGIINILDAGPAEFLSLIACAEYVVTNSFHGTAFSVNFGVNFYTMVSAVKKNNSRMESLLGLVGLKNRIINDDVNFESIDISNSINFESAHKLLNQARESSENYLKTAVC